MMEMADNYVNVRNDVFALIDFAAEQIIGNVSRGSYMLMTNFALKRKSI